MGGAAVQIPRAFLGDADLDDIIFIGRDVIKNRSCGREGYLVFRIGAAEDHGDAKFCHRFTLLFLSGSLYM